MQLPANKDACLKYCDASMVILLQQEVNNLTRMMNSSLASERTAATFISLKVTLCIHHMAILAGITDALCLQRFHCFVTMMTGNTIVMSISLSEKRWKHALWRASLITSYLLGAVCVQSFELTSLKWIVPIVTGIFSIVSVFCMPRH
jgi:uncharacterized membrane protein YoaK (UPF0700 family)